MAQSNVVFERDQSVLCLNVYHIFFISVVYMERESVIKRSIPTNQNSDPLNDDDNNEGKYFLIDDIN